MAPVGGRPVFDLVLAVKIESSLSLATAQTWYSILRGIVDVPAVGWLFGVLRKEEKVSFTLL